MELNQVSIIERCPLFGGNTLRYWYGAEPSIHYREVYFIRRSLLRSSSVILYSMGQNQVSIIEFSLLGWFFFRKFTIDSAVINNSCLHFVC